MAKHRGDHNKGFYRPHPGKLTQFCERFCSDGLATTWLADGRTQSQWVTQTRTCIWASGCMAVYTEAVPQCHREKTANG